MRPPPVPVIVSGYVPAVAVPVLMLNVDVVDAGFALNALGVELAGFPARERLTGLLKPPVEFTVTV